MMLNKLPKLRKLENLLLQLAIFAATYLFIYRQVFLKTDLPQLWYILGREILKPGNLRVLLIVSGLMFCNWFLEAAKWRYLINRIEKVSYLRALQAVFTGVSISTFTPNRVGEYIGRVFLLKNASRIEGILITIVGSMSQLLVTVTAGTVSLLLFFPRYMPSALFSHGYIYYTVATLIVGLDLILLGLFFNLSFLSTLKERILQNGLKRIRKFFRIFAFYHNFELAAVMTFSMARYAVFSTQYFLLIRLFGIPIDWNEAIVLIALVYLIMTVIPTIALTELGIRGSVALYFFELWFAKTNPGAELFNAGVLAASVLLWMINLGIPAVIGTVFVFRLQFFRKQD